VYLLLSQQPLEEAWEPSHKVMLFGISGSTEQRSTYPLFFGLQRVKVKLLTLLPIY